MIRTVLELDLASYTDIAVALEEALDVHAVRRFEDQIQAFVDDGLKAVGLERAQVVLGTAGDNAILVFESAELMHKFAATVQHACRDYNAGKTTQLARRWFRMGAATGMIEIDSESRRIIGSTIARAVRLEAAAETGSMLIDPATYESLPKSLRHSYGWVQTVKGKRGERYKAYSVRFIEKHAIDESYRWRAWRNWIGTAAVVACLVGAALAWGFFRGGRGDTPRPISPIHGTADIRVFNRNHVERNDRSISYDGLLPLRPGDCVRLEVNLDRPAFIYLVWIAPSGNVIPVYPWHHGDWTRVNEEKPTDRLVFPGEDSDGFPMKANVQGREIFLALVRSTPLPSEFDLKAFLSSSVPKLPVRNSGALVRFRNSQVEATVGTDRDPDFLFPSVGGDPFLAVADKLKSDLTRHFELVDGAAFASQAVSK
jgi:class 3 adenylate cyclase